jgi:hypothetical protein
MRLFLLLMASGLSACAGQPASPAPPSASPTSIRAATTDVQQNAAPPADPNLANLIKEAKAKGFKLVDKDGKQLYCREDFKTGSHLQKETTCLDQDELATLHDRTQQSMMNLEHQQTPQSSH